MSVPIFHNKDVSSKRILYTPSNFARSNLLSLQETGSLKAERPHVSRREGLGSYLFFVVKSGEGKLIYNDNTYLVKAGECVFIDCHKPYAQTSSEKLWDLSWAHFFGPNMASIYSKYLERGGLPVFGSNKAGIYLELLDNLYNTANSSSYVRDMEINSLLAKLLVYLMEDSWHLQRQHLTQGKALNVQQLKDYVDAHYTERLSLDSLAKKYYVSKYYMLRLFKEQFGTTVSDYILHCRINKAKQLLRFTDKTTETIGEEVGLGGANYLARMFKKVEGVSPSDYRRMW